MYRKCVTDVSVEHQRQLENSLLELMQKMPYETITVTQLCREAGISRRIFYHLFSSKTDALHALIDHRILDIEGYLPEVSDSALRFFRYWQENRPLLDALKDNDLTGLFLERMLEIILEENRDVRFWLKSKGWSRERDVIIFHLSGIMGLVYRWYYSGFRETPEEMALLLKKILTTPLMAPGSGT